ncbi:hypothetical protein [Xanthomonas sp. BRIP62409]|uniref:hypothetical protein n=1 Tax=Xanthomonas sp. BRIP62409 TaxID=2182388 RepID=UPI000F8F4515|nr:hypothetical protein [Xanthomonas sp. BRIP62409]
MNEQSGNPGQLQGDAGSGGDGRHILSTSDGARSFIAKYFAGELKRHDFAAYIKTRLAADFACALAVHLAARQPVGQERHTAESARALADRAVQSVELIGTLAGLPSHVQGVVRSYAALVARSCLLYDGGQPAPAAVPVDALLASDHSGMRVDYSGLIRQTRGALTRGERDPALAEMQRQLAGHLEQLGKRWYAGDTSVVDELLQLYCIEPIARAGLKATHHQPAAAKDGA